MGHGTAGNAAIKQRCPGAEQGGSCVVWSGKAGELDGKSVSEPDIRSSNPDLAGSDSGATE